jgi:hypothetical protein
MTARWNRLFLLVLGLAVLIGSGCFEEDQPVARVNDKIITRPELDRLINLMRLCNPGLDDVIEAHRDNLEIRKIEMEFLQILIDVELVRQEAERLSLFIDQAEVDEKTEVLVEGLLSAHYGSSPERFHKRRKQLSLSLDDLSLIPYYELQLQALFDFVSLSLTDDDLLQYVEENPGLLQQAASVEVFRISFSEESDARRGLEALQQGMPIEVYIRDLQARFPDLEAGYLGWITEEDPFVETVVIQLLFSLPQGSNGVVLKTGESYNLYWVREAKSAAVLEFSDIKEQVFMRKQYIMYQDYFNTLWSEGEIEILYHE